jgi:glycerol-3-phosphate dehydrogenase
MTQGAPLDARARQLEQLGESGQPLDILVVGGGITGAGVLLEATRRGLRAALIEEDDLAVATSSRTSKLIHGGLRYLEQFQFGLVHEALKERARIMQEAPHLVRLESFLVPVYGSALQLPFIGAGLALYGLLGAARDGHRPSYVRPSTARSRSPSLRAAGLRGGFTYDDGVEDDARFVVAAVRTAIEGGATALTRVRACGFLRDATGRVTGVDAEDRLTGRALEIRASVVVDATGAHASGDTLDPAFRGDAAPIALLRSRGIHLVLPRERIPSTIALTIRIPGRVVFLIPWSDVWLLGTTDHPHEGSADRPQPTSAEVDELLDAANGVLDADLARADVVAAFAGVRPLVAGDGSSTVKTPRTHAFSQPAEGLIVVRGGKFTTHGTMARETLDRAGWKQRRAPARTYLVGGEGAASAERDARQLADAFGLDGALVARLVRRYGGETPALLEQGRARDLLRPLDPASRYLEAEVLWAVEKELALGLDDVLARRLRLAIETRDHGASVAERAAAIAGDALGWTHSEQAIAVTSYVAGAHREYDVPPEAGRSEVRSAPA